MRRDNYDKRKTKKNKRKTKDKTNVYIIILMIVIFVLSSTAFLLANKNGREKLVDFGVLPVEVKTATIGAMGDLLLHPQVQEGSQTGDDTYDFNPMFQYIKPYIEELDYSVINFEGTLSTKDWGYSGYPLFKYPENVIDSTMATGFNLMLTANNHIGDGKPSGFQHTLNLFEQKGADYVGSRKDATGKQYLVKEINGINVGMANWTYGVIADNGRVSVNGIPVTTKDEMLVNVFDYGKLDLFYQQVQKDIVDMKNEGAEIIVYYMHWGDEYRIVENDYQNLMAQQLCNMGVDVIVGGHPHVLQPIEYLTSGDGQHNTISIYSLGNAVSNQRMNFMDRKTGHTEDGVLFRFTITKEGKEKAYVSGASYLPTWVNLRTEGSKRVYEIIPLDIEKGWKSYFKTQAEIDSAKGSYDRSKAILEEGYNSLVFKSEL
ncbi:MAG: poly-gamma-glutamate synthesis protein (capsule biosynthesis protein) [Fusobacteria bacterium]|nr:MAG: poly-gamma-glutamate synthesis protein (capsule biosynthesis protein) [Fusobacteriota bacterium]KAF0229080.1 MAG: poly-gamma-glutamate synthesis protein [Fusobacteriota bacterium]